MTLYEQMMEDVAIMDRQTVSDGMGGFTQIWVEGAVIKAAIGKDSTLDARVAEQEGMKQVYTVTTYGNVLLQFHDVLKRKSDGKIFRLTGESKDNASPSVASFSMAQAPAEEWILDE